MIFTREQQEKHRAGFIEECRQKAWGARCHADWVSKGLDSILAEYEKITAEDAQLAEQMKTLELAADSYTKDNRDKRKELQAKRNGIAKTMQGIGANMQQGQKALAQLHQSAEASLELAKHAEGWEWEEVQATIDHEDKATAE